MSSRTAIPFFYVFLLIIAMASIQSGASLAKNLFAALTPQGVTALRLLFSSLILLAIWRPWRHRPDGQAWRLLALYGTSLGAMNLFFYMSLQKIPLGVAVALEFTGPLLVAVLSSRHVRDLIWVLLAIAGIVLLLPVHTLSMPLDMAGVLYALAAGACWALYIVFGQRAGARFPGGVTTAYGMMFAAAVAVPYGVLTSGPQLLQFHLWPAAFGVAVLSSALPYSLEMLSLQKLPARTFSVLMSLEPALAALSGLMFLREYLTPVQMLAIALLMTASIGTTLSLQSKRPA